MDSTILSTKTLSAAQQELLLNSGYGMVHYNSLKISYLDVDVSQVSSNHIIITSSNAIPAITQIPKDTIQAVYCVGNNTAARLTAAGYKPSMIASNGTQLANDLVQQHAGHKFLYLCGKDRRDELPSILTQHQVHFIEAIVYESVMVHKSFDRKFAAVLMYSPRGVYAFAKANTAKPKNVFCIGQTTAQAAREFYDVVHIANKQTVENVIVTAIKVLNNDKK